MRDLTQPITAGMQTYPGDPEVTCSTALSIERDGVAVSAVCLGSHTGTHIDAPAHVIAGGRTLAEIHLGELCGEAIVLRVPGLSDRSRYGLAELEASELLPSSVPPIVIIDTGWARHFGSERALHHPFLDGDAANELVRRGMHVLAVDTHSPDATCGQGTDLSVHRAVLGSDGLVVENLTNLAALPERIRVGFFAVRLGQDGAPVRAVAFEDDLAGWGR